MFTDPISDMLTRIRNASAVKKAEVDLPYSKVKWAVAQILSQEGFLKRVEKKEEDRGVIKIFLKYNNNSPVINSLQRISKPGRRLYVKTTNLPKVRNGLGISIISTPQGIMTNKEAFKRKVGGEIICEVY